MGTGRHNGNQIKELNVSVRTRSSRRGRLVTRPTPNISSHLPLVLPQGKHQVLHRDLPLVLPQGKHQVLHRDLPLVLPQGEHQVLHRDAVIVHCLTVMVGSRYEAINLLLVLGLR